MLARRRLNIYICCHEAIELFKSAGKKVFFEYSEGNHYGPLIERIEKAIVKLN